VSPTRRHREDDGGEEVLYLVLHVARLTADALSRNPTTSGS
jgi:hypothetical protein